MAAFRAKSFDEIAMHVAVSTCPPSQKSENTNQELRMENSENKISELRTENSELSRRRLHLSSTERRQRCRVGETITHCDSFHCNPTTRKPHRSSWLPLGNTLDLAGPIWIFLEHSGTTPQRISHGNKWRGRCCGLGRKKLYCNEVILQ